MLLASDPQLRNFILLVLMLVIGIATVVYWRSLFIWARCAGVVLTVLILLLINFKAF